MSSSNNMLPVISLNEKSLQRLCEKYQKLVSVQKQDEYLGQEKTQEDAETKEKKNKTKSNERLRNEEDISDNELQWDGYNPLQSEPESISAGALLVNHTNQASVNKKQLFDPQNPDIPIYVSATSRKENSPTMAHTSNKTFLNTEKTAPGLYYPAKESLFGNDNSRGDHITLNTARSLSQSSFFTWSSNQLNSLGETIKTIYPGQESSSSKCLKEADQLESTIYFELSSSDFTSRNFVDHMQQLRNKLIEKYRSLILTDIDLSFKHNVDQAMWKNVFHQIIEKLRQQISSCSEMEMAKLKHLLIAVINEASTVYENLISSLESCYELNLKQMLQSPTTSRSFTKRVGKRMMKFSEGVHQLHWVVEIGRWIKKTKLAIICCQKCLICLGDIARYKENVNGTLNYGKARHFYIQARCLEPKNGRPYNQLAVLAVRTRRRLDAIYYYIRSLATSGTPIITARESLTSLFDDARRKLKYIEDSENQRAGPEKKDQTIACNEFWVFTTGTEETKILETKEKHDRNFHINKSSTSEMLKKFILVFLNVHGKLFTKIGFDSLETKRNDALNMFKHMINGQSLPIMEMTVLHLCAINFFNVYEQQRRSEIDQESHTFLLEAVEFSFETISILSAFVTKVVHEKNMICEGNLDPTNCRELSVVLPALKVSFDWMYANRDLWYPSPPSRDRARKFNIWDSLAKMCDWLCDDRLQFPINILSSDHPTSCEVTLPEDEELSGFRPLYHSENDTKFVSSFDLSSESLKERTHHCIRFIFIREFLGYLCGMEEPLLAFKNGSYVVVLQQNPGRSKPLDFSIEDVSELVDEEYQCETLEHESFNKEGNKDISDLQLMHISLKQEKHYQDKRKHQIQASLSAEDHGLNVEVRPNYLIPDTNCFVDHLNLVQALLDSNRFVVCIPLVVVAELEGLAFESKGMDQYSMGLHKSANTALTYLKQQFQSNQASKLQALTNQGSPLDTISFVHQDNVSAKGSNDDLILNCCTKFDDRQKKSSNGLKTVVLLSDDRNLRVKAMIKKMPTKSVVNFCKLAKIS